MLEHLNCTFHHLGIACDDLDREAAAWLALGYDQEGPDFEDPVQRVRGRFLTGPGPRLELLVGTAPDSPVSGVLRRGAKIYHQGYATTTFEHALAALRESGIRVISGPSPAVAFGGRRIAFLLLANTNVIELVENG